MGGMSPSLCYNLRTADFWVLGMVLFEFLAEIIVEKLYLAGIGLRFKFFLIDHPWGLFFKNASKLAEVRFFCIHF